MRIDQLWPALQSEGYTEVHYYEGPSPTHDGTTLVALLDEFGGIAAIKDDPSNIQTWRSVLTNPFLRHFSELPSDAIPAVITPDQTESEMSLVMAESARHYEEMSRPLCYC